MTSTFRTVARPPVVERNLSHISPDLGYIKVSNKGVYIGTPLYGPQDAHHLAAALNVDMVLCLQTAAELDALDINLERLVQEASFAGMHHVHAPLEAGLPIPAESLVKAVASLIDSRKMYVHDADGGARAATVVVAFHYWVCNMSMAKAVSMVDAVCVGGSNVATEVIAVATQTLLGEDGVEDVLDAAQHALVVDALRAVKQDA